MNKPPLQDAQALARTLTAFQQSRTILTGHELGVFPLLARSAQSSKEAAESLGCDPRATDRLLNALAALGLLVKEEGRFSPTALARDHLVPGQPGFMGFLGHAGQLWKTWSSLTEAVRAGTAVAYKPMEERGPQWAEKFITAMHARGRELAPKLAQAVGREGVGRVLDVGGGSGVFAMAFVRDNPGSRATVLDLEEVVALTRRYVEQAGLAERFDYLAGDYHATDLGQGYDLVLLSAIIHINSAEENSRLIGRIHRALAPGGRLVIREFIMDPDRTGPLFGALFALNMLVGTERGDTYTEDEIRGWCQEAGFGRVERPAGPLEAELMIAHKD